MASETFTWERQSGAAGRINFRIIEAQFGDGYSQVVPDGLNTKTQSWPLSFEGNMNYMQPILDFFARHKGAKSFYWTPPGEPAPLLFRASDLTLTSRGAGVYSLAVEFKQVFYK